MTETVTEKAKGRVSRGRVFGKYIAWVIILMAVALPGGHYYYSRYRARRVREERRRVLAKLQNEMREFTVEQAPELQDAIDELALFEQELALRVSDLVAMLTQMKETPQENADFRKWNSELMAVREAHQALQAELEAVFLMYRESQQNPGDAALKADVDIALERGNAAAREAIERYRLLRAELKE